MEKEIEKELDESLLISDNNKKITVNNLSLTNIEERKLFEIVPTEDLKNEQYFFSENFINNIYTSFGFVDRSKILCLCTPAISTYFKLKDEEEFKIKLEDDEAPEQVKYPITLDSDKRFDFLPNFYIFNLNKPKDFIQNTNNNVDVNKISEGMNLDSNNKLVTRQQLEQIEYIFFDPPFFQLKPNELRIAVDEITNKDYTKKIFITYSIRESAGLIFAFKDYNIRKSKLRVEYQYVPSNKWGNYGLYTNFEISKIKFE